MLFRGFLQVYEDPKEENGKQDEGENENMRVPLHLKIAEILKLADLKSRQHFTKPPARFTESSLVKELDALGIGRPSTYAVIIGTIQTRKYVEKNQRQIVPTELGRTVTKILIQNFDSILM